MMKADEDAVHAGLVAWLNFALPRGAVCWHTPNTFPTAKIQYHQKLKRMARRAGIPDLLILHEGLLIGLEVKTATGRQSPEQKAIEAEFKAAGAVYEVVRGVSDAERVLRALGALKSI